VEDDAAAEIAPFEDPRDRRLHHVVKLCGAARTDISHRR
jgi:hypothetical protein